MRIKTTTNCGSMFIVVLVAFSTMRDNSFAAPVMPPATTMELWGATWQVDGALVWTNDTALNRYVRYPFPIPLGRGVVPVSLTSGEISHASYSIEAFVRIPPGSLSIDFGVSGTNAFYRINLFPARNGRQMSRSVQFGGKPAEGEWPCTMPGPRFTADNISPVLDEEQRIRLENDFTEMSEVGIAGTWHRVRAEVRPETVTLYVDGLLQGSGPNKLEGKGAVRITMNGTVSVDSFEIKPLPALAQQFTTAPLDGLVNASSFVDRDSLKSDKAGFVNVGGVPFLLPSVEAGRDHVDVGVSLYRYNRQWGYDPASKPTTTYIGPQAYDPSELKFYVPHASYSRVWILAAADGEPDSTPILTVRFFKPGIGWEVDSARAVPEWAATNAPSYARRVDVVMKDGKPGFLWAIPIDIDSGALAGDYRDQGLLMAVELTKQTYDFVAYPDPCSYGSFQGGLPSSARVYGVTFEKAPVSAYGTGEQRGNLYPFPEKAKWFVEVKSQSAKEEKSASKCVAKDRSEQFSKNNRKFRSSLVRTSGLNLHRRLRSTVCTKSKQKSPQEDGSKRAMAHSLCCHPTKNARQRAKLRASVYITGAGLMARSPIRKFTCVRCVCLAASSERRTLPQTASSGASHRATTAFTVAATSLGPRLIRQRRKAATRL